MSVSRPDPQSPMLVISRDPPGCPQRGRKNCDQVEVGLGFLPGIELAEGDGRVSDERDEISAPGEMPRVWPGSTC